MAVDPRRHRRHLEALRACALYPEGMRYDAYPSLMPDLWRNGLVEIRPARGRPADKRWHLTPAGRKTLEDRSTGEPRE